MRKAINAAFSLSGMFLLAMSLGGSNGALASELIQTPGATATPAAATEIAATGATGEAAAVAADAQIASVTGAETRVNQGDGYAPAAAGMLLKVGDGLFTGPGSQIVVTYIKAGCSQVVSPESFARVEAKAPCSNPGTSLEEQAMAVPNGQTDLTIVPAVTDPSSGFCATSPELCVAGVAAVTATVAVAIVALTQSSDDDDDDDPASPN